MQKKSKTQPVICGIDIGAWTVKISCYDGEKFQTLTNEANFRQTPSLVAFTPLQRMIGESANIKMKSNYANTIRSPMRLIGLGRSPHFIQQQLKYSTVNYDLSQSIQFQVTHNNQQLILQPQQILIALMTKIKQIVQFHNFHLYAAFLAVPSYFSNSQRSTVRKCAHIVKLGQVHLIDDWVAVSSEYSYYRVKQLKAEIQRNVLFIDVGYSKISIYVCQFTSEKCILMDYQHLKYTGSKNMDNHMIEFYDDYFHKQTSNQRIITNAKALIKIKQMIQKQRKVLSANSEHHLNLQYLINEQDLNYNMKREQFQNIIMPVLSELASALSNIKSRVAPKGQLHAVQLIGGASRIPLIQQIVADTFNIEPSKTLNSSQAMARGANIYGAIQTGFINFPYQVTTLNFAAISVVWNSVKNQNYLGQNPKAYTNKKIVFDWNCRYPCQSILNFGPEGIVELYIHYQHQINHQSIGYLRINTPNKVVFVFDKDKIISAKCVVGGFLIYNFHQIKEQKWQKMQKIEKQLQQNDKRITTLYDMKNTYQSLIYKIRQNINTEWLRFSYPAERENILKQLKQAQRWIQQQNQKQKHSEADINELTQRIQGLSPIVQIMRGRKQTFETIEPHYRQFVQRVKSKQNSLKNMQQRQQLQRVKEQIQGAYKKMEQTMFQNSQLMVEDFKDAMRKISRII